MMNDEFRMTNVNAPQSRQPWFNTPSFVIRHWKFVIPPQAA
jgi:hypothetical protein